MTVQDTTVDSRADDLRHALGDRIILAADPGYDAARMPWNLAADQRPYAVARPVTAEDVVDVVRAAAAAGLRIAPQSTGHAASALAETDLSDTVLVVLAGLRGVTVDPVGRTARVLGGSVWNDVIAATAPYGLTALHGSAGNVSVAGYALRGGVSFYARAHGLAVGAVREVQLVTADGALMRASADEHPDLFWALRGGSGAFGIVVSLVIDLLPYADVFAGFMIWDASHAAEVTRAWAQWTKTVPNSVTTTLRVLHIPPLPELPPFLSGRSVVAVDGAILETDAEAAALLGPLRALQPEVDMFARIPAAGLLEVHMDPPDPTPAASAHSVLAELPDEAVDAFLAVAGDQGLFVAELRHLGGELTRRPHNAGAVGSLQGEYLLHTIAMVMDPAAVIATRQLVHGHLRALDQWRADALALTFVDGGVNDYSPGYGEALEGLRVIKHQYDPTGVFASGLPI